jgi:quinol-cytochrome oxidoreductase complex cytochrome b subunit
MSRALRALLWVIVAAAFVFVLFTVVFPWFDREFVNDPVLGAAASALVNRW